MIDNSQYMEIIALRDIDKKYFDQFIKLDDTLPEVVEIKKGYSNPLIISNIITMRLLQLQKRSS